MLAMKALALMGTVLCRSCRARLLQHNARRRKRDPLETSRKDVSRKGKSHHPWSDSSNDADMVHSGDLSNGMSGHDKVSPLC